MVNVLEESYINLRLELSLIVDVGTDVVKLAPTAYDHWYSVILTLSNIKEENVQMIVRRWRQKSISFLFVAQFLLSYFPSRNSGSACAAIHLFNDY